jgi:hypothetical protein
MSRCSRRVMDRIANLTLRQPGGKAIWLGVDIAQGASPFRGMRHHESKHRMRRNPRRSRSPAAPQPHPRWKDAGVYVDDNGQRGPGGQRHFRQRFFGRGNQDGMRSAAIKTVGAPIHPLAVGVISEVDATMPPELPEASNFQDDDETEGWIR